MSQPIEKRPADHVGPRQYDDRPGAAKPLEALVAERDRVRHFRAMDWQAPPGRESRPKPEGEWVVFHERPFPEKMDRVFRVSSAVVGCLFGLAAAVVFFVPLARSSMSGAKLAEAGALALMLGGFGYAVVRMVGMFTVGISGLWSGGKRYIVDWQPPPGPAKRSRETTVFMVMVVVIAVLLGISEHR